MRRLDWRRRVRRVGLDSSSGPSVDVDAMNVGLDQCLDATVGRDDGRRLRYTVTYYNIVTSNKCIAVRKVATPLRELTCHMGSHSVTCHPAEVTFPPLATQSLNYAHVPRGAVQASTGDCFPTSYIVGCGCAQNLYFQLLWICYTISESVTYIVDLLRQIDDKNL